MGDDVDTNRVHRIPGPNWGKEFHCEDFTTLITLEIRMTNPLRNSGDDREFPHNLESSDCFDFKTILKLGIENWRTYNDRRKVLGRGRL